MNGSQLATMSALSEAEVTAIAYEEAAGGDSARALRWAVDDLIAPEGRLADALRVVSRGYVRGKLDPKVD